MSQKHVISNFENGVLVHAQLRIAEQVFHGFLLVVGTAFVFIIGVISLDLLLVVHPLFNVHHH